MSYDKRFSDKAINYLERVKRTGIENRQKIDFSEKLISEIEPKLSN